MRRIVEQRDARRPLPSMCDRQRMDRSQVRIFVAIFDERGQRPTRDLNKNYLLPLAQAMPQQRALAHPTDIPVISAYQSGQQPGNGLLTCETCHYRLPQPLNGANMVKDYPGLEGASPPAKDADPHPELTRAPLKDLQKPCLAASDVEKGALQ